MRWDSREHPRNDRGRFKDKPKNQGVPGKWVRINGRSIFIPDKRTAPNRRSYVSSERVVDRYIKLDKPLDTRYVLQFHRAERAGDHFDFRILINGRAESWAMPNGFPKEEGDRMAYAILQPAHHPTYMEFQGPITEGYGKGTVRKAVSGRMDVTQWNKGVKKFSIYDGPLKGDWCIRRFRGDLDSPLTTENNRWIAFRYTRRKKIPKQIEAPKARVPFKDDFADDPSYVVSRKLDGARYFLHIGDNENRVISRQKSVVTDLQVERTDNLPHIRDMQLDKFNGTIFDGEMIHRKGFEYLSSVMGSGPMLARERQRGGAGKVQYYIIDCPYYKGKYIGDLPLIERRKYIERFYNALSPDQQRSMKLTSFVDTDKRQYHNRVIDSGGEGTMWRRIDEKYFSNKWGSKNKKFDTYDFYVGGYEMGTGKYEDQIGALIIYTKDKNGKPRRVGKVGSGFTDRQREEMTKDIDRIVKEKRVIEVKVMEITSNGNVRAPVFLRWRPDKTHDEIDKIVPNIRDNTEQQYKGILRIDTDKPIYADKSQQSGIYRMNRGLGSDAGRMIKNPVSHTFLASVNKKKRIQTYGWGNTKTRRGFGRYHIDHIRDMRAAKQNFNTGQYRQLASGTDLIPRLRTVMANRAKKTSNYRRFKRVTLSDNCKFETSRIWNEVMAEQK